MPALPLGDFDDWIQLPRTINDRTINPTTATRLFPVSRLVFGGENPAGAGGGFAGGSGRGTGGGVLFFLGSAGALPFPVCEECSSSGCATGIGLDWLTRFSGNGGGSSNFISVDHHRVAVGQRTKRSHTLEVAENGRTTAPYFNCAQLVTDREPTPALPHVLSLCVNAPDERLIHPLDCRAPHP
jgi:hypothetical protein